MTDVIAYSRLEIRIDVFKQVKNKISEDKLDKSDVRNTIINKVENAVVHESFDSTMPPLRGCS